MTRDLEALRTAAGAATPGPWEAWSGATGGGGEYVSTSEYVMSGGPRDELRAGEIGWRMARRDAAFIAAARPEVVLALIARLEAAEAAEARVAEVACGWDSLLAFMVGVGSRPDDARQAREIKSLSERTNQIFAALEGRPSSARERWTLEAVSDDAGSPVRPADGLSGPEAGRDGEGP